MNEGKLETKDLLERIEAFLEASDDLKELLFKVKDLESNPDTSITEEIVKIESNSIYLMQRRYLIKKLNNGLDNNMPNNTFVMDELDKLYKIFDDNIVLEEALKAVKMINFWNQGLIGADLKLPNPPTLLEERVEGSNEYMLKNRLLNIESSLEALENSYLEINKKTIKNLEKKSLKDKFKINLNNKEKNDYVSQKQIIEEKIKNLTKQKEDVIALLNQEKNNKENNKNAIIMENNRKLADYDLKFDIVLDNVEEEYNRSYLALNEPKYIDKLYFNQALINDTLCSEINLNIINQAINEYNLSNLPIDIAKTKLDKINNIYNYKQENTEYLF